LESTLSPKQFASVVGVSESSLKRWADGGRLNVVRTAGGHRRIPVTEAIRFAREANLPIRKPSVLGLPELQTGRASIEADDARLTDLLVEQLKGDAQAARATLMELYLAGRSLAWICDGPLQQAMARIGEIWRHDPRGIYLEHRATDICLQSLRLLRSLIPPAGGEHGPGGPYADRSLGQVADASAPSDQGHRSDAQDEPTSGASEVSGASAHSPLNALGGAVAGDPYQMPTLMAACVLEEVGLAAINLGADLPVDSLMEAVDENHPRLVWLACSVRGTGLSSEAFRDLAGRLEELGGVLALGGRGFDALAPIQHDHVQHCRSMGELAAFARGLSA